MKNTLKKLLITTGISLASISTFANTFSANVQNDSDYGAVNTQVYPEKIGQIPFVANVRLRDNSASDKPINTESQSHVISVSRVVKLRVPEGAYDFGNWKAGEYPVVWAPKEIHPFVTYNGKGYVACSGDTTAQDVPGQSDAWKEINDTIANACGEIIHSYKKQSSVPVVAKAGVAFW